MSDYSRLADSIESAGYSKEGWADDGVFTTYRVSCVIDHLASTCTPSHTQLLQAEDKYMQMSAAATALIKEIRSLYLDEVLDCENPTSNLAKLSKLCHTNHWG